MAMVWHIAPPQVFMPNTAPVLFPNTPAIFMPNTPPFLPPVFIPNTPPVGIPNTSPPPLTNHHQHQHRFYTPQSAAQDKKEYEELFDCKGTVNQLLDQPHYQIPPGDLLVIFGNGDPKYGIIREWENRASESRPTLVENFGKVFQIPRKFLEIQKIVGSGNFGKVYKGKFENKVVAIKEARAGSCSPEQFVAEAKIMMECKHENLVELHAIIFDRNATFIITEFMSNGSLLDYLRRNRGQRLMSSILMGFAIQAMELEIQTHCKVMIDIKPTWNNGKRHFYKSKEQDDIELEVQSSDQSSTPGPSGDADVPPGGSGVGQDAASGPSGLGAALGSSISSPAKRKPSSKVPALKPKAGKQTCRLCGSQEELSFWLGCGYKNPKTRREDCAYWVHQHCIGLFYKKEEELVKLPFFCPKHGK